MSCSESGDLSCETSESSNSGQTTTTLCYGVVIRTKDYGLTNQTLWFSEHEIILRDLTFRQVFEKYRRTHAIIKEAEETSDVSSHHSGRKEETTAVEFRHCFQVIDPDLLVSSLMMITNQQHSRNDSSDAINHNHRCLEISVNWKKITVNVELPDTPRSFAMSVKPSDTLSKLKSVICSRIVHDNHHHGLSIVRPKDVVMCLQSSKECMIDNNDGNKKYLLDYKVRNNEVIQVSLIQIQELEKLFGFTFSNEPCLMDSNVMYNHLISPKHYHHHYDHYDHHRRSDLAHRGMIILLFIVHLLAFSNHDHSHSSHNSYRQLDEIHRLKFIFRAIFNLHSLSNVWFHCRLNQIIRIHHHHLNNNHNHLDLGSSSQSSSNHSNQAGLLLSLMAVMFLDQNLHIEFILKVMDVTRILPISLSMLHCSFNRSFYQSVCLLQCNHYSSSDHSSANTSLSSAPVYHPSSSSLCSAVSSLNSRLRIHQCLQCKELFKGSLLACQLLSNDYRCLSVICFQFNLLRNPHSTSRVRNLEWFGRTTLAYYRHLFGMSSPKDPNDRRHSDLGFTLPSPLVLSKSFISKCDSRERARSSPSGFTMSEAVSSELASSVVSSGCSSSSSSLSGLSNAATSMEQFLE